MDTDSPGAAVTEAERECWPGPGTGCNRQVAEVETQWMGPEDRFGMGGERKRKEVCQLGLWFGHSHGRDRQ